MSVQIQLEDPRSFYSNLDFIKGRVILSLNKDENISGIFVKLEGESRSALMRPVNNNRPRDRNTVATENHKVLYKVAQVFPSDNDVGPSRRGEAYTLRAGTHEYPFRFKIPFNNGCSNPEEQFGFGLGFGGVGLTGMQHLHYRHVKRTLPPSLTGFPDMAQITYYVKVTVQRPSLFKENRRSATGFRFLPMEPPRPAPSKNEVFARRPYVFQPAGQKQKSGIFGNKRSPSMSTTPPPKGEVEARLPSPAIVTCNKPIPLRIIVRNLSESSEQLFLMSLQFNLIESTEIRAMDVARTETITWAMMTLESLAIPIGNPGDKFRTETFLDKKLWDGVPLPNTVAPSFHTCNLSRRYELEVRVVLGYGLLRDIQVHLSNYLQYPKTNNLYDRLKPSPYRSVSKLRSILVYLHPQLSSMLWRPATPPLPNVPRPHALQLPLQTHQQRNLPTTRHTHHSSPHQPSPKTTRRRRTRMLLQMTSLPLMGHAESTPASRMLTRRQ